jgi:hypothetical protein
MLRPSLTLRRAGALGAGTERALVSLRIVLRESPVAWAAFEGPLA